MPNLDRDFYLDKQGLRQLINELETNIVALEYDTSVSYSVGDYCVYENNLYRCITATTGVWDSTAWDKVIIGDELRRKVNSSELSTVAFSGDYDDLIDKPTIPDEMVVLSYGHSNWQDFIDAYTTNRVVYCRASSNSNPATGSQTRMAFMAYVNDGTAPTSVEFQYYRSVSTHSATQQGDQVYIYKLEATNGGKWTVTVREAMSQIAVGSNMTSTYANGTITLDAIVPTATSELTNDSNFVSDASYVHTDNNFTTTLKDKLDGIEAGAEVNQNAFGEVQVGSTTISASSETDTLGLVGSNVTLTPDATNKEVTIGVTGANVTSALGYTPTNIQSITTAQWEALTPEQKASGDYVITDATTVPLTAENVPYDDTVSGLTADNVQDAIDELSQSSGASSVAQLEDVQLNNLSDNDLLVYDSNLTGGKLWKNAKKIVTCTKAQFDTWSANNTFPYTDCKYIVTDVNNLNTTSADIPYDSTGTDSVKDVLDLLLDRIYPVGSIYMSVTDSTVEAVQAKFGGTWVRFGAGRTLVGYDSTQTEFDTVEETGGEKAHTLAPKEIPSRVAVQARNPTSAAIATSAVNASWSSVSVAASGTVVTSIYDAGANGLTVWGESATTVGGQSHNNLQPYITVYMYKRTA